MRSLLVAALTLSAACSSNPVDAPRTTPVRIDAEPTEVVFQAEIADSPAEWQRGLMNRRTLADDAGMLFVFDQPRTHDFWMKDTLIALDLISIRAGRVVAVATMQPCTTETCPTTRTPVIDAALEVKAGTAERAGIEPGALVEAGDLL